MAESKLSTLRYFRSFRLNIYPSDKVGLTLRPSDEENGVSTPQEFKFQLINLSLSGLAFESEHMLDIDNEQFICAEVEMAKSTFTFKGKIVRVVRHADKPGFFIYGLKLEKAGDENSRLFIEKLVSHFTTSRLKKELAQFLIHDITLEAPSLDDSMAIMEGLYLDLKRFDDEFSFIHVFLGQAKHYLECADTSVYLFNNKSPDQVELFYPRSDENIEKPLLDYTASLIEQVRNQKKIIVHRFSEESCTDSFYRMREALLGKKIEEVLICPLFNHQGEIIGIIDYINKSNEHKSEFSAEDKSQALFLSFLMISLMHKYDQVPLYDTIKFESPHAPRKYALIGQSNHAREMRAFVQQMKLKTGPIILTGSSGVGKELLARILHTEGPNGLMPYGVLDIRDLSSNLDLAHYLKGDDSSIGKLDLYSGGALILKSIEFLTPEQMNIFAQVMQKRSDLRLIMTSQKEYTEISPIVELMAKNSTHFHIHPLAERKEDIYNLVRHFFKRECELMGLITKSLDSEIFTLFENYDWPENITELQRAIERLVLYYQGQHIITELPPYVIPAFDSHHNQRKAYKKLLETLSLSSEELMRLKGRVVEVYEGGEKLNVAS